MPKNLSKRAGLSSAEMGGAVEILPLSLEAGALDPELQELQGTVRHIHTQLTRYRTTEALLGKHGIEKTHLELLERLGEIDLYKMSEGEMEAWKDMANEAIEKVFPLLQEAREVHLAHQDRVQKVREQHSLDEMNRLDELALELLPSSQRERSYGYKEAFGYVASRTRKISKREKRR